MKTTEDRATQSARILLAGTDPKFRQQWKQGLPPKCTVHEIADREALTQSMTSLQPTVLILDLAMCAPEGVNGVRGLQQLCPSTKIMLLTDFPDPSEGVAALRLGAKGYCTKEIAAPLLKKAMEMIQEGQIWVERSVIPYLLGELATGQVQNNSQSAPAAAEAPSQDSPFDCLTPRERAVASLIADGAWNKEIAGRLNITEATVKAHLTAIFRKLGVTDRLQLGLFLARHAQGAPAAAHGAAESEPEKNSSPEHIRVG